MEQYKAKKKEVKEKKEKTKKDTSLKKEYTEFSKFIENNHVQRQIRFRQILREHQVFHTFSHQFFGIFESHRVERESLLELHQLRQNQKKKENDLLVEWENEKFRFAMDFFTQKHPLQLTHLRREQEIEARHLGTERKFCCEEKNI